MNVYAVIDDKEPFALADFQDWSNLSSWIQSLPVEAHTELVHLYEHGWCQRPQKLRAQMKAARNSLDMSQRPVAQELYKVAAKAGKNGVLVITKAIDMAVAHAPAGGVTIQGQQFTGGEFIPSGVMDKATPDEKAKVTTKPNEKVGAMWNASDRGHRGTPEPTTTERQNKFKERMNDKIAKHKEEIGALAQKEREWSFFHPSLRDQEPVNDLRDKNEKAVRAASELRRQEEEERDLNPEAYERKNFMRTQDALWASQKAKADAESAAGHAESSRQRHEESAANEASRQRRQEIEDKRAERRNSIEEAQRKARQEAIEANDGPAVTTPPSGGIKKRDAFRKELAVKDIDHKAEFGGGDYNPDGAAEKFKVYFADGRKGLFKPRDSEADVGRENIYVGSGYKREVAASVIGDILGYDDIVVNCTFRNIDGQDGALQDWVEDERPAADYRNDDSFDGDKDLARAAIFDYLIQNTDRHGKNWMLSDKEPRKILLIDHGNAFPVFEGNFRSFLFREAYTRDLPVPFIDERLWPKIESVLKESGLEDSAIQGTHKRFDTIVKYGGSTFPDLPRFTNPWDGQAWPYT